MAATPITSNNRVLAAVETVRHTVGSAMLALARPKTATSSEFHICRVGAHVQEANQRAATTQAPRNSSTDQD